MFPHLKDEALFFERKQYQMTVSENKVSSFFYFPEFTCNKIHPTHVYKEDMNKDTKVYGR